MGSQILKQYSIEVFSNIRKNDDSLKINFVTFWNCYCSSVEETWDVYVILEIIVKTIVNRMANHALYWMVLITALAVTQKIIYH